jgi:putative ABC transport system permease protein
VVADVTMKLPFMPHSGCVAFLFGAVLDDHEMRVLVRARRGQQAAALAALHTAFAPVSGADQGHFVHVQPFDSTRGIHHKVGGGMVRLLSEIGVMMGVVALLASLAATSFLVAERKRQIGVRRALGATRADIVRYFLVESGIATLVGALVGLVFTVGLYALMVRVFQDITFQAVRIGVALGLLCLASLVATLLPALGAARVPPSVASRSL